MHIQLKRKVAKNLKSTSFKPINLYDHKKFNYQSNEGLWYISLRKVILFIFVFKIHQFSKAFTFVSH